MRNAGRLLLVMVMVTAVATAVQPRVAAGEPSTPQQVLVVVSPEFHPGELNALLAGFANKGAKVYVTSPGDVQALWESIAYHGPELLHPMGDREPVEVLDLDAATGSPSFDKMVLVGGQWYRQFFVFDQEAREMRTDMPAYAEDLFGLVGQMLTDGKTLGAYGSGLYPLVLSNKVPSGTKFAAYYCADLIQVAKEQSLSPQLPPGLERRDDIKPRSVPDAQIYFAHGSWRLVTASVPNAWYGRDEGELLMERYGEALSRFVDAVEDAYNDILVPGLVESLEPDGGPYR